MDKRLVVELVRRMPQGLVSRGWGWVARRRRPTVLVTALKHAYARLLHFDMSEAAAPIDSYASLEALFVRQLREGARPVDTDPDAVVSPVDGTVGACGVVRGGTLFQIKGRSYRLSRLLDDEWAARRFESGPYATLYLAPHDYHRIHAPVSGVVREARVIPGKLLSVFPEALERVDELLARNERVVSYLDLPASGRVAVVKVGAMLVGCVRVSYDPSIATNVPAQRHARVVRYDEPHRLDKGAPLGAFSLGSTVVLIAEPRALTLEGLTEGQAVRVGQRIGTLLSVG